MSRCELTSNHEPDKTEVWICASNPSAIASGRNKDYRVLIPLLAMSTILFVLANHVLVIEIRVNPARSPCRLLYKTPMQKDRSFCITNPISPCRERGEMFGIRVPYRDREKGR